MQLGILSVCVLRITMNAHDMAKKKLVKVVFFCFPLFLSIKYMEKYKNSTKANAKAIQRRKGR